MKHSTTIFAAVLASLFAFSRPALSADAPKLSNKWRIQFDNTADAGGDLVFTVTPKDGTALEVRVTIATGTSENQIAKAVSDAFKTALDKEQFASEVDDGEDVLVKKRKGPDFALQLTQNTLQGVDIDIEQE